MELRPDEITKVLRQQIEQYTDAIDTQEVGSVLQVGDGIARVHGLENCVALEMLELPHGVTEVHLHGGCFRLIPTPRAQSDPFNHANERLTGPCLGNF